MKWIFNSPGMVKSFNEPKSFFIENFSASTVRAFSNCVTDAIELQQQILPIYIESYGGDIFSLKGILSIMESARKKGLKFSTITSGCAMSAGAFVFCYGDSGLRFIGKEASLMIHGILGGHDGKISEMRDYADTLEKEQYALFEMLSKHLKKYPTWMKKQMDGRKDRDWFLTSTEAKEIGIADHIEIPVFSVEITASVNIIL